MQPFLFYWSLPSKVCLKFFLETVIYKNTFKLQLYLCKCLQFSVTRVHLHFIIITCNINSAQFITALYLQEELNLLSPINISSNFYCLTFNFSSLWSWIEYIYNKKSLYPQHSLFALSFIAEINVLLKIAATSTDSFYDGFKALIKQ